MKKNIKILVIVFVIMFVDIFFVDIVKGETYTNITGSNVIVSAGGGATILNYSRDLVRPMVKITMVNSTGTTTYGSSAIFKLISGAENSDIYSPNKTNAKILSTRCNEKISSVASYVNANREITVEKFDELTTGCNMNFGKDFVDALINDLKNATIVDNVISTLCSGCTSSDINSAYFIIEPVFMWGLKTRDETKPQIFIGTGREMYSHIYDSPEEDIEYIIYGSGGKSNPNDEQTGEMSRIQYLKILLDTMKPTNTSANKLVYQNYFGIVNQTTSVSFNANGMCGTESCLNYPLGFGIFKVSDFITVTNCQQDFDIANAKPGGITMADRVSIYLKYKNHSYNHLRGNYRALLDESNATAASACKIKNCSDTASASCFDGSFGVTEFGPNNLSCYNDTYSYYDGTNQYYGFCNTYFDGLLNKKINTMDPFNFKAGRLMFNYKSASGIFANVEFVKNCYIYKSSDGKNYTSSTSIPNYSATDATKNTNDLGIEEYKLNFNLDEEAPKKIENVEIVQNSETGKLRGNGNNFKITRTINLKFKEVYSKIIDGANISESEYIDITNKQEKNKYNSIGYGPYSKLNQKSSGKFTFSYKLIATMSEGIYKSGECDYNISPEIVTNSFVNSSVELGLEFRNIDTDKPFSGKTGGTRRVGSNWAVNYTGDGTIVSSTQMLSILSSGTDDLSYDYNGDQILNMLDYYVARGVEEGKITVTPCTLDNMSSNCLVLGVMADTNNSYNKKAATTPIYKITLTPDTILEIREYNKTNPYDDLNLSVDSTTGEYVSNFLNEFASGTVDGTSVTGTFER